MKSFLIEKSKTKKKKKEAMAQEIPVIKVPAPIVEKDKVIREVTIQAVLPVFLQLEEIKEKEMENVDIAPVIIKPVFTESERIESRDVAKLHPPELICVEPAFEDRSEILEKAVKSLSLPRFVPVTPKFFEVIQVGVKREAFATSCGDSFTGTPLLWEDLNLLERTFGSPFNVISEHPIVIFAQRPEDRSLEYIEFLKRILLEIYRIRVGSLPNAIHISSKNLMEKIDEIKAGNSICVVEVDEVDTGREKAKEEARELEELLVKKALYDKLREIYAQGFGFLVFYGKAKNLQKLKRKLWNIHFSKEKVFTKLPRFLEIKVSDRDMLFKLPNLMWGIFNERPPDKKVAFDEYAIGLENSFLEKLERFTKYIITADGNKILTALLVNPSENESLLHYALKAFVVEYLNRKLGISMHLPFDNGDTIKISTEKEFGDIKIDVFVDDEKLGQVAIEVETLYGTCIPLIKLRKTAESRVERGFKTWIVIPNPQLMIYLKDVLTLRDWLKKRYGDLIEFYTLDIENAKLIPIREFIERIRDWPPPP
ncbi:hypothetical protein P8X24_11035 [Pyrococcus kukulkanii]|uniref:hypothetical protein n=1 Tax=Pyrococcus kukulkanii TaxID=1609559 RepID=UPI0035680DED